MRGNQYFGANFQGIGYFQVQARQLTSSAYGRKKKMLILLSPNLLVLPKTALGGQAYLLFHYSRIIFIETHHSNKKKVRLNYSPIDDGLY